MGLLLLLLLVLVFAGSFPRWGHSRDWGYRPSGVAGVLIVVVLLLMVASVIPHNQFSY